MNSRPLYKSYSTHFKELFGERIQKVTINAGFTCPNRDGSIAKGGCTFCLNEAFNPSYCDPQKSITQQINEGIEFHARRYAKATKYLAYFQAYSNTHKPLEELREIYNEALSHPSIIGIVVGTRPDCVDQKKLDYFAELSKSHYVAIEYGVESIHNKTLEQINRGHTFEVAKQAIEMTK
ncbi:MAG: TIGR01212 family radical SAM protein, partial [Rikenellaceae bacterium]